MAFKPNYRQQRNERVLAKEQKKQEKLQRRNAEADKRKVEGGQSPQPDVERSVAGEAEAGSDSSSSS